MSLWDKADIGCDPYLTVLTFPLCDLALIQVADADVRPMAC